MMICFMLLNLLINKVYYFCTFYTSQARLIRENAKNGNFYHFPQLDRLEGYKNVLGIIVLNKAYYIKHFLYSQARLIRENAKNGNFYHFP